MRLPQALHAFAMTIQFTEIEPDSPSSVFFAFGKKSTVTLAVPEKRVGCFALFLAFFDRGAKPCSLYPPPAALAGFAL